jgi:hypothetical protein
VELAYVKLNIMMMVHHKLANNAHTHALLVWSLGMLNVDHVVQQLKGYN